MTAEGRKSKHLTILGAGPAGLAAGYYALRSNLAFTIYEAEVLPGGSCVTFSHDGFLFDSGAHRFHDRIPAVTEAVLQLVGDGLIQVSAPSQIFLNGALIDFPLSPLDLVRKIGMRQAMKGAWDFVRAKLDRQGPAANFEDLVVSKYGRTIAESFLLNYSKKLWGRECRRLSARVAGRRIGGLDWRTFVKEALLGTAAKTEHLDGVFYYPARGGIGAISDSLAAACGTENLHLNSRVSRVLHRDGRVSHIEINGNTAVPVDEVVSTLPIDLLLATMDPDPPPEISALSDSLSYRGLTLVALFLDRVSVTDNASVYFPEAGFPFTRVYEPKNRSPSMSPPGKTSLVAEIPNEPADKYSSMPDETLAEIVASSLVDIGWINKGDVQDRVVKRMKYAYPVLEVNTEDRIGKITKFLNGFENLRISGRNGRFEYTHLHDMMQLGKDVLSEVLGTVG